MSTPAVVVPRAPGRTRRRRGAFWTAVAVGEIAVATVLVAFDVFLPTILLLALAALSLVARREGPATLGFHRLARPGRAAAALLALTVGWTVLQLGLFFPALEHLTGQEQDLGEFAGLQGSVGTLLALLALTWTVAAVGEESVYRGYLQTRITDVLGSGRLGIVVAVLGSSLLFGLAHTEQGLLGVVATFLDALFFSALRLHYGTVWAPVLAHGFNNTLGFVAFFVVGPVHGLW